MNERNERFDAIICTACATMHADVYRRSDGALLAGAGNADTHGAWETGSGNTAAQAIEDAKRVAHEKAL